MTADRWSRLSDLIDGALAQPSESQDRWLRATCADDETLYREATALLASENGTVTAFRHALAGARNDFLATRPIETGTRLGPYRITRLLAQGGQSAVYGAFREDAFEKRVAIKFIKYGFDTDFARRRFQQERQILAHLDHPNIAHLLDGGDSEHGLPYLVMEFVEGRPLIEAAAGLSLRARLALFRRILDAVAYAHRNLVVHRDLKPSNILVTRAGVPKLLDFGVARLLEENPGVLHTVTSTGMMTPDYASPEQVKGEPAGVASDIYSLGALLYELLSGARPHRLSSYATAEVFQALCQQEAYAPSAAATDPHLRKQLRGDLDTLVLTALAKDPSRRYVSAESFAAEIDRFLEGRPLQVRPASPLRRGWKFVRRNRLGVTAVVALAVSLVGGIALSTFEGRRAERRFAQVRELANTFLFQFYDQVTPLPGSTAVRASMVETARKYLDGLASEAGSDKSLLFELAQAYQRLGQVQSAPGTASLGMTDGARESFRRALDLYGRLDVNAQSAPAWRGGLAVTLLSWCEIEYSAGHERVAEPLAQRALDLVGQPGTDRALLQVRALAERNLGEVRLLQGRAQEAVALLEAAERDLRTLEPGPGRGKLADEVLAVQSRIARTRARLGDLDGALGMFREILRETPPCNERRPSRRVCQNEAMHLSWTGDLYGAVDRPNLHQPASAAPYYEHSARLLKLLADQDRQDRQIQFDLAARYGKLGDVVWATDPQRALKLYADAQTIAEQLLSREQAAQLRASYLMAIARPLLLLHRTAEARRALSEAIAADGPGAQSQSYADRLNSLDGQILWARLLAAEGKPAAAVHTLEEAIRTGETLRAGHPKDLAAIYVTSNCYRELASIAAGEPRRQALLHSAAAWHAWPPTSYTRREEQTDFAALQR